MKIDTPCNFTFTGLCSGAGGLDLGFELAGFRHQQSMDSNPWAIQTLTHNRPDWLVSQADLHDFSLTRNNTPDVLLAGVPFKGSLLVAIDKMQILAIYCINKLYE